MTFSDDFGPGTEGAAAGYPTVLGVELTPAVSGLGLGALGLLVGGFLWLNFVQPARSRFVEVRDQHNQLQQQLAGQPEAGSALASIESELRAARERRERVLSLLSSEDSLDTLLIDLERTTREAAAGVTPAGSDPLELLAINPVDAEPEIVTDGSFGELVDGRVKRQRYDLSMDGTFQQTRAVLDAFESLQPLLIVRNLTAEVSEPPSATFLRSATEFVPTADEPRLATSFQLEAVLPLSASERAELAAQEAAAAEAEAAEEVE